MSSFLTWTLVAVLMMVCGLAMARLLWIADGKPPLRRSRRDADEPRRAGAADRGDG